MGSLLHKITPQAMSFSRSLKITIARFIASATFEKDLHFRAVVLKQCRKAMAVTGALGMIGATINVAANAIAGKTLGWVFTVEPDTVALWDKLCIFLLSAVYWGLSRTAEGPRLARPLGAVLTLIAGLALLIDDLYEAEGYGDMYFSLFMLIILAVLPYRPRQALVFVLSIWALYLFSYVQLPGWLGVEATPLDPGLVVYVVIFIFFSVSMSTALYYSRYTQYRGRHRVELLKQQVSERAEQLRETERLKTRFFTNISHEFRTPLTLILGPLEDLLTRDEVRGAVRSKLERMQRSTRRLLQLINQLLDLSKLEAAQMSLKVRPAPILPLLQRVVQSFAGLAEEKKIEVQLRADEEDLILYFETGKIEQVLVNVLSNAFAFTPPKGKILVHLSEGSTTEEDVVKILIRDTGPGIPKDQQKIIFDRFRQVDDVAGQVQQGTGIGLALAKELVELHGGRIHVESEVGFGSAFIITLPSGKAHFKEEQVEEGRALEPVGEAKPPLVAQQRPVGQEEGWVSEEMQGAPGCKSVLVVDDNADMRAQIRDCLGETYHIVEAGDGQQGLDLAKECIPDLIIADVMMPRMNGFVFCAQVKQDVVLDHIPVILLTARASQESKVEGLETGADAYLIKPFHPSELQARVRNLIDLRQRMRERYSRELLVQPSGTVVPSAEEAFLHRARDVVEAHMGDASFGVEEMAEGLHMSARQLQRKVRALIDQTPSHFIRQLRLQQAAQLLQGGTDRISDVAFEVGFNSATYFATCFRELYGTSPSDYATSKK